MKKTGREGPIGIKDLAVYAVFLAVSFAILWLCGRSQGDVLLKSEREVMNNLKDGQYAAEGYEGLAEKVDRLADTIDYRGTVLLADGDRIVFAGSYGFADEGTEPNAVDTVFAVGSVSKQFTAAAVLQLAQQGKLSLAEPISDFFPDYADGGKITVLQLLNMESGIGRDFWSMEYSLKGYTTMDKADEFQAQQHSEDELLQIIYDSPLEFQPGTKYMYSNVNYYLLSLIVAKVSGETYQQYVADNLFKPCGMTTAFLDFNGEMAKGHSAGTPTKENASLYEGCGTVCVSALDLYRWNRCLHGGKVLSQSAYSVMTEPKLGNYACGLLVEDNGLIWHNGELNGYNAYNAVDPGTGLMVIALANDRTYSLHGQNADFPAEQMGPAVMQYLKDAAAKN